MTTNKKCAAPHHPATFHSCPNNSSAPVPSGTDLNAALALAWIQSEAATSSNPDVKTAFHAGYTAGFAAAHSAPESAERADAHRRVLKYDGSFRCFDCRQSWGALPGNPVMPATCELPASERAKDARAEAHRLLDELIRAVITSLPDEYDDGYWIAWDRVDAAVDAAAILAAKERG